MISHATFVMFMIVVPMLALPDTTTLAITANDYCASSNLQNLAYLYVPLVAAAYYVVVRS